MRGGQRKGAGSRVVGRSDRAGSARQVPLRTRQACLSHLLLTDDRRVRIEEIWWWLIDWTLVFSLKLPRGLWFPYPLLRGPIWLWRQLNRLRTPAR